MKNKRLIIRWIMLIIWMAFIFFMSHQPGDVSSKQSDFIVKIFEYIGLDLNGYFGSIATFVIRKAAHFTEYFILYILVVRVLKLYYNIKIAKMASLVVVLGYAISDEIHQYFIPGRAMALKDVIIDFSGGVFGFIVENIYSVIKYRYENNRNKKTECI